MGHDLTACDYTGCDTTCLYEPSGSYCQSHGPVNEFRAYVGSKFSDEPVEADYLESHPGRGEAKASVEAARRGGHGFVWNPRIRELWRYTHTWEQMDSDTLRPIRVVSAAPHPLAALATPPLDNTGLDAATGWQPRIGEQVEVTEDVDDWLSWREQKLFVAGVQVHRMGLPGLEIAVSEDWPRTSQSNGLTDDFWINRPFKPDMLRPARGQS